MARHRISRSARQQPVPLQISGDLFLNFCYFLSAHGGRKTSDTQLGYIYFETHRKHFGLGMERVAKRYFLLSTFLDMGSTPCYIEGKGDSPGFICVRGLARAQHSRWASCFATHIEVPVQPESCLCDSAAVTESVLWAKAAEASVRPRVLAVVHQVLQAHRVFITTPALREECSRMANSRITCCD